MENLILINANPHETRVAILEGGDLVELYVERGRDKGVVGNIYKGKVVRVLPGMQAAFVDIGLERTAFLHVTDIYEDHEDFDFVRDEDAEEEARDPIFPHRSNTSQKGGYFSHSNASIEDLLRTGQDVLVQVLKEPLGTKGARLTSYISIPGRYLVFMPTHDHIGVSKKIEDEKERRRLRKLILKLRDGETGGFIIRTACEGKKEKDIKNDMDYLTRLWKDIQRRWEQAPSPSVIYRELDLTLRTLRDLFTEDIDRVIIDSEEEYNRILRFVETYMPHLKRFVELYDNDDPLFEYYGVEVQISEALEKRVWLKSGGYIVIDQTEAVTTIDVNTGKYVGRRSPEETILKTNLEAVKEIAYQLRLRNIGGIIIIDFIDMDKPFNRQRVYKALREALKGDRAKAIILQISDLGLVEMTRKRVRESLVQLLCTTCPYCEGRGFVKSKDTVVMDIYRALLKDIPKTRKRKITLYVHPEIAEVLYGDMRDLIEVLEKGYRKRIVIKSMNLFHIEQFEIT